MRKTAPQSDLYTHVVLNERVAANTPALICPQEVQNVCVVSIVCVDLTYHRSSSGGWDRYLLSGGLGIQL